MATWRQEQSLQLSSPYTECDMVPMADEDQRVTRRGEMAALLDPPLCAKRKFSYLLANSVWSASSSVRSDRQMAVSSTYAVWQCESEVSLLVVDW